MSYSASLKAALLTAVSVCALSAAVTVDPKLPDYKPLPGGVSGTIKSVGSDTMNNMMALWGEDFKRIYPNVQIEIEGKETQTGKFRIKNKSKFEKFLNC